LKKLSSNKEVRRDGNTKVSSTLFPGYPGPHTITELLVGLLLAGTGNFTGGWDTKEGRGFTTTEKTQRSAA